MQGIDARVVIELFAEGGQEFTALVLDVGSGNETHPVTLLPTEVVILVVLIFDRTMNIGTMWFSFITYHVYMHCCIHCVEPAIRWKFSEEIQVMASKKSPSLIIVGNICLRDRYYAQSDSCIGPEHRNNFKSMLSSAVNIVFSPCLEESNSCS